MLEGMSWSTEEFGHPDHFEGNFRVSFVRRECNAFCAVACRFYFYGFLAVTEGGPIYHRYYVARDVLHVLVASTMLHERVKKVLFVYFVALYEFVQVFPAVLL